MRANMDSTFETMTEPATSTAGGIAAWKLLGGAAGAAGLASLIVMCMMPPRSLREWIVGLTSTVVGSVCGGAAVVQYLGLHAWADNYVGMVALLGVVFACGLPAWMVVRWAFTFMARRADKDLAEVAGEVAGAVRGR